MSRAVEANAIVLSATLEAPRIRVSQQLYWMLLMLSKNAALQIVVGAGRGEGLEAWKLLVERYEPRLRTRYAAQLMKIMGFSLQGDLLERLGLWERERERDTALREWAGEDPGCGVPRWDLHASAPRGAREDSSATCSALGLTFVKRSYSSPEPSVLGRRRPPWTLSVAGKGNKGGKGAKGGRGGQGKKCSKCGKMGHTQENCWAG